MIFNLLWQTNCNNSFGAFPIPTRPLVAQPSPLNAQVESFSPSISSENCNSLAHQMEARAEHLGIQAKYQERLQKQLHEQHYLQRRLQDRILKIQTRPPNNTTVDGKAGTSEC